MRRWIILLMVMALSAYGQMKPSELFKQKWSKYYSSLNQYVDVIEFKMSSPGFIYMMDTMKYKDYHYLMNVKWMPNGRFEFSHDSSLMEIDKMKLPKILRELDTLKNKFTGISFDLQSLLMENPLEEIPLDAEFWAGGDSVAYQFTIMDKGKEIVIRRVFLRTNGLLLKQLVAIEDKVIYIFPMYTDINQRWQCVGWDTQIYQDGKITGGFANRFDLVKYNDFIYLPEKIQTVVKVPENPNELFISELFLYKFKVTMKNN
ncbi:MAG: hypothetical protein Kow00108_00030 [Calditrichia bacterium]